MGQLVVEFTQILQLFPFLLIYHPESIVNTQEVNTLYQLGFNIHPELTFKKYQYTKIRLSEINKKMGWGVHYNRDVPLEEVRSWFAGARSNLIKVR